MAFFSRPTIRFSALLCSIIYAVLVAPQLCSGTASHGIIFLIFQITLHYRVISYKGKWIEATQHTPRQMEHGQPLVS
jgi:hypothetical protein